MKREKKPKVVTEEYAGKSKWPSKPWKIEPGELHVNLGPIARRSKKPKKRK